jgi:hypothetical protein
MNWNQTENYFLTTYHPSFMVFSWVLVNCGQCSATKVKFPWSSTCPLFVLPCTQIVGGLCKVLTHWPTILAVPLPFQSKFRNSELNLEVLFLRLGFGFLPMLLLCSGPLLNAMASSCWVFQIRKGLFAILWSNQLVLEKGRVEDMETNP